MIAHHLKTETLPPGIDPGMIREMLPFARTQICMSGEKLMESGEPSDSFAYVEEGLFEVSYQAQGTPIVVAVVGQGALIGEIGFFDHQERTRHIQALCYSRLRVFDREAMQRLRSQSPSMYCDFMEFVLRSVCGRFRHILSDRGPLTAYAASLATGHERFETLAPQPLPPDVMGTSIWQQIHHKLEEFKADMFEVAHALQRDKGAQVDPALMQKGRGILDRLRDQVRQFGPLIDATESADLMWSYIFKEVFPYLMRSRFAERAYYKPKGYAGDFMMIERIYRNQPEGDGKLGLLVDAWSLDQTPARAVRARRQLLGHLLERHCRERLVSGETIRIMNLACGPSRELFDFIAQCSYNDKIEAVCVDIDAEALQFADRIVNCFPHRARVRFMNENVIKWALGRVRQDFPAQDIIYSSGLTDYLDERLLHALIERCHNQLKPGGTLIIGNFSSSNPDRLFMDRLLYWRLIYRDRAALLESFNASSFEGCSDIIAEEEGVNLFAIARRSA